MIRTDHLPLTATRRKEETPLASLDDVEREQVVRVLTATDHHKGRAAAILGVSRPRLRRLMGRVCGIE